MTLLKYSITNCSGAASIAGVTTARFKRLQAVMGSGAFYEFSFPPTSTIRQAVAIAELEREGPAAVNRSLWISFEAGEVDLRGSKRKGRSHGPLPL